jgi:hypothetical protein
MQKLGEMTVYCHYILLDNWKYLHESQYWSVVFFSFVYGFRSFLFFVFCFFATFPSHLMELLRALPFAQWLGVTPPALLPRRRVFSSGLTASVRLHAL